MMRVLRGAILTALLVGGGVGIARAQQRSCTAPTSDPNAPIDRVVAVAGTVPILSSQLDEDMFQRCGSGQLTIPADTAEYRVLRRRLLDTLVDVALLYQEAQRDTMVKVTDEDVSQAVEQVYKYARRQFPNDSALQVALQQEGFKNLEEWKRLLTDQQRKQITVGRFRQQLREKGVIRDVPPRETEIRALFERAKPTLQPLATISLKQIVVSPVAAAEADARSKALADSIVAELRKGADFATAARRFSMDPGSRQAGGDLGYHRRGDFVREFDDATFNQKIGIVSNPVKTTFGWHIIQVIRIRAPEVQVRHILLMPEIDSASARAARDRIEEIAAALDRGASFDSLQRLYHDPAEGKDFVGYPIDSLPAPYRAAIESIDTGKVTKPFLLVATETLRSKWAIAQVLDRAAVGEPSYDFWRERVRTSLARTLGEQAYLAQLRKKAYVDIRAL